MCAFLDELDIDAMASAEYEDGDEDGEMGY